MSNQNSMRSGKRLYVLVRKDLNPSYRAVQAGHAVAKYMLDGDEFWENEFLIYLGVKNKDHLEKWADKLWKHSIDYEMFREPDLNHEPTALAAIVPDGFFKSLRAL